MAISNPKERHPAVRRLLVEAGFSLARTVGRRVQPPLSSVGKARASGIPSQEACKPEMTAADGAEKFGLAIEGKAAGFGEGSSDAAQAVAYLLLDAENWRQLTRLSGAAVWGEVAYSVPAADGERMAATLQKLAGRLAPIAPTSGYCVLGLDHRPGDGVYLSLHAPTTHKALGALLAQPTRVLATEEGDDGYPPVQSPVDPAVDSLPRDPLQLAVLESAVRRWFASTVARNLEAASWLLDVEGVLISAIPSWRYWQAPRTQQALIQHCRGLFLEWLRLIGLVADEVDDTHIEVAPTDAERVPRLRRRLRSRLLLVREVRLSDAVQLPLLPEMAPGRRA